MTITRDQAQMLTALAVACRPYRAPTWDEPGVMAAIGQIRHMSLPEVCLRVIRAAADREAVSPGVIPKDGSHAREQLKPPPFVPDSMDHHLRCSTCDLREGECRRRWAGDHEYEPRYARPEFDVPRAVAELRVLLVDGKAAPSVAEKSAPTPDPRADAARAALHDTTAALTATEPTEEKADA
jgi:hypothetical protein